MLQDLRLLGKAVAKHVERVVELFRYNRRVFVAPPWEEIFEQDSERKQDFAEAVRTYEDSHRGLRPQWV